MIVLEICLSHMKIYAFSLYSATQDLSWGDHIFDHLCAILIVTFCSAFPLPQRV